MTSDKHVDEGNVFNLECYVIFPQQIICWIVASKVFIIANMICTNITYLQLLSCDKFKEFFESFFFG